jgi:hypothetical protein
MLVVSRAESVRSPVIGQLPFRNFVNEHNHDPIA